MPTLTPKTWPDVLSWFVTYRGSPVDATVTADACLILDGMAIIESIEEAVPRDCAHMWIELATLRLWINESQVEAAAIEDETDRLAIRFRNGLLYDLRPVR